MYKHCQKGYPTQAIKWISDNSPIKSIHLYMSSPGITRNLELYSLKNRGVISLPNVSLYIHVSSLIRILDWYHCRSTKLWTTSEDTLDVPDITIFHGWGRFIDPPKTSCLYWSTILCRLWTCTRPKAWYHPDPAPWLLFLAVSNPHPQPCLTRYSCHNRKVIKLFLETPWQGVNYPFWHRFYPLAMPPSQAWLEYSHYLFTITQLHFF